MKEKEDTSKCVINYRDLGCLCRVCNPTRGLKVTGCLYLKTSGFSRSVRLQATHILKLSGRTALVINTIRIRKRTIKTLSHCYYEMKYHLVWTPKYRGKVLGPQKVKDELRRTFETITRWKHWEIIELNIQEDHIHMILSASPRDSISYIMQMIKGTKAQLG